MAAAADESPVFASAPAMHRRAVRLSAAALRPGLRQQQPQRIRLNDNMVGDTTGRQHRGDAAASGPPERPRGPRHDRSRAVATPFQRTADTSWSGNDFDLTGVLFEDAWFAGARFSGRHVCVRRRRLQRRRTRSFEDVEFNAEVVSFDGASFESDATFAGCDVSGPQRLVRRCLLHRQGHVIRRARGSQASTSRFDASGSPASRRRSARRYSSACARRSTRPPSGRTSSSTGTTLLAEASRRSRAASRRGRGRRTSSEGVGDDPRAAAQEKDDDLDG